MLQNKIYQNFIKEILKTFFIILLGLSLIAWTVRAVNFLDLIVESGYSVSTYFQYSFLNLFGILTKFIPLSFLLALIIFVLKQIQENEFTILVKGEECMCFSTFAIDSQSYEGQHCKLLQTFANALRGNRLEIVGSRTLELTGNPPLGTMHFCTFMCICASYRPLPRDQKIR